MAGSQPAPGQPAPGQWAPGQPAPGQPAPGQPAPGQPAPGPAATRLAVVSPHLDDAVLGCGDLIARYSGAVVITAFAGRPDAYPELTSWDARAGFGPGNDVVAARREEDRRALEVLGATPRWLDFPDPQYGARPPAAAVSAALTAAMDDLRPDVVAVPLGLFHDDHTLTSDAALAVTRQRPDRAIWLVYADAIYRRVPGLLDERLAALRRAGLDFEDASSDDAGASERKRRAVGCYASQLRALAVSWDGGYADAFAPERIWQLRVRSGPMEALR